MADRKVTVEVTKCICAVDQFVALAVGVGCARAGTNSPARLLGVMGGQGWLAEFGREWVAGATAQLGFTLADGDDPESGDPEVDVFLWVSATLGVLIVNIVFCSQTGSFQGLLAMYSFAAFAASGDVITGCTSKSTMSSQFAVHWAMSDLSLVSITCQQHHPPTVVDVDVVVVDGGVVAVAVECGGDEGDDDDTQLFM
ncbi:hypothetical protein Pelo_1606 [Pelomyxa schiedti]|nr:hypothetical protein Pelo_1606 [Pelomyxa schiedti]